jgi:starch phosphorylase
MEGSTMTWPGDDDLAREAEELAAKLPDGLGPLAHLAFNYWWSWAPGGPELFGDVDPYRWAMRQENPLRLLLEAPADLLSRAAENADLMSRAERLHRALDAELAAPASVGSTDHPIAFLCAEYGVHGSLPTYGGGLGILAGDILKEASDLAMPFVAVGILYRQGNFHQRIDLGGWQHEYWIEADPDRLPMALVTGEDGVPLTIEVPLRGREILLQIWRVAVGRVPLYLLDAARPENSRVDQWITSRLYVGDRTIRLAQYALLGMGGIRALRALGIDLAVFHLNEGHAALAPLELAREEVETGRPFEEALAAAKDRTVFTTHTPVPAGNETYSAEQIREVLGDLSSSLGTDEGTVLGLGRSRPEDPDEPLGLTVLGIRASRAANAVSEVHGQVSRVMWSHLFPGRSLEEVPLRHVTNGVHLPTWMAPAMRWLLDLYLGEGWHRRAADPATWEAVDDIPDEELWSVRGQLRADLVELVRDRAVGDRLARAESIDYAEAGGRAFDPDALTLGFARRVAAYKRLGLLIHDPDRARQLLHGPRPVQVVLAGKAHPSDWEAKQLLQRVFVEKWGLNGAERVTFVEDYEMGMASHLVAGCDVWLNLPRPPLEASGTSGMKAGLNGGLNLSVLDGWWAEGYDGSNGWAIEGDGSLDPEVQDARDAGALYDLLENEVLPTFYERDGAGIPAGWVRRVKASLRTIGPRFCATRMMREYLETTYRIS